MNPSSPVQVAALPILNHSVVRNPVVRDRRAPTRKAHTLRIRSAIA